MVDISFLGAAGTVTGSKYLLEGGGRRVLVDCGLFQGYKNLRLKNWRTLPVDPDAIEAVLLTHAHIDHSGYLPLLIRNGFSGPVYCSEATRDLCEILLPDSGYLQEKDAEFANRHDFSKHHPALPLYSEADGRAALESFQCKPFDEPWEPLPRLTATLRRAGHILGAACLELELEGRRILFSGDLGRPSDPLMPPPWRPPETDYLIVESTYGDRRHDAEDPAELLARVIRETTNKGGSVLIPAFAVGRSQLLLYHLWKLFARNAIPKLPVFLDSPMAINASEIFLHNSDSHRLSKAEAKAVCGVASYVRDVEGSKALDSLRVPAIVISASGMATGGRVLHHLKHFATDTRNTILFTGFQAAGTRGADMLAGAKTIKIHGRYYPVRARVSCLDMLSAHADADEIMAWLKDLKRPPRKTMITHGEPEAAESLRLRIEEELGWLCEVPEYRDCVTLD